jgi:hypothetical protein
MSRNLIKYICYRIKELCIELVIKTSLSGLCVADNSTSLYRYISQKKKYVLQHVTMRISRVSFFIPRSLSPSLCVRVTFLVSVDSERHFIVQKNFNWSFLACCEIRIYSYDELSGPELDRNRHLTALSDETVHEFNCSAPSLGKFLWW